MISILPSEGLAPSQSAPKQNTLPDNPAKSDERPFSSFVSRDAADQPADSNAEPPTADQSAAAAPEPAAKPKTAKAETTLLPDAEIAPELVKAGDAAANVSEAETRTPAEIETSRAVAVPDADTALADTESTTRRADPETVKASLVAQNAEASNRVEVAPATRPAIDQSPRPEADPAQPTKTPVELRATADTAAQTTAKATRGETDTKPQVPPLQAQSDAADDVLRVTRGQDTVDLANVEIKTEIRPSQLASSAELAATTDKTLLTTLSRDSAAPTAVTALPDSLISLGQSQQASTPVVASALNPVAPSVPVAAPSEISAIILNALKNGVDPQEQLIVQLDPPELGRVSIDFKFDAQGVQQITVTSENPEALKRLRELHFELTEALKDHGLTEKNMSFRQQSDQQSQPSWQMPELAGSGAALTVSDDTPAQSTPVVPSNAPYTRADRLDLTL